MQWIIKNARKKGFSSQNMQRRVRKRCMHYLMMIDASKLCLDDEDLRRKLAGIGEGEEDGLQSVLGVEGEK